MLGLSETSGVTPTNRGRSNAEAPNRSHLSRRPLPAPITAMLTSNPHIVHARQPRRIRKAKPKPAVKPAAVIVGRKMAPSPPEEEREPPRQRQRSGCGASWSGGWTQTSEATAVAGSGSHLCTPGHEMDDAGRYLRQGAIELRRPRLWLVPLLTPASGPLTIPAVHKLVGDPTCHRSKSFRIRRTPKIGGSRTTTQMATAV
jgi:hypothetical protein